MGFVLSDLVTCLDVFRCKRFVLFVLPPALFLNNLEETKKGNEEVSGTDSGQFADKCLSLLQMKCLFHDFCLQNISSLFVSS